MSVPDYQQFMLPVLQFAEDGKLHTMSELRTYCYRKMKLSEADLAERLSSGGRTADSRIYWAKAYLIQARALESPRRGTLQITDRGRELLALKKDRLTNKDLERYQEFRDFHSPSRKSSGNKSLPDDLPETAADTANTPEEQMDSILESVNKLLAADLVKKVIEAGDTFFEDLVVDLIRKMGYGIDGHSTQRTNDGGIDGVIYEDRLGLNMIYLQAKLWRNTKVSRPEIQKFIGSLSENKAQKGIFITTSDFSAGARECAAKVSQKVILIDGLELVKYMITYNVGVSVYKTYEMKRIDLDYFE